MKIHRRDYLKRTLGTALAASSLGLPGARPAGADEAQPSDKPPMLPIVDTHQHLWDLSKLRLPWLKPGTELYRSYVTKDYLAAIEGLNVVMAVYMEVAVAPEHKLAEAEHIIEVCRRTDNPTVAAVIGGEPASDGFKAYITRFKDSPYVKGVRQILPQTKGDEGLYAQKRFARGVQLLGELGMSFDLCMPPARLPDAVKLVDACPNTRFILDHCGNADPKWFRRPADETAAQATARRKARRQWQRDVAALAKREHVVSKISGIVARAPKDDWTPDDLAPIVNHCIEVFGQDRVMFASDWPVCTRVARLREWVGALKQIIADRDQGFQRRLLGDNAVRFYGLA